MINSIISFSIKNKLIIALFTLAIIIAGIWSISKVPLDAVPDITNNQVQVITLSPNLGTEDIERFITYPVELAMANLPNVIEIRSVSKFGLSLVTIVFKDEMGTYLPRQLVGEKLNSIRSEIPMGLGKPMMGPISTGLGEIYQYSLDVEPKYKEQYSASDLRTIQDWLVGRQMAMVPGVVEVNGFGGDIKQYEVAVHPDELKSMGITISEVFEALESNNENTGGAYIEKNHQANFIRGEGLARSVSDIENIVVKNSNGIPILIKNVAEVRFGKAIKYGAFTKNGEGEAVGGMIMMLKESNSNQVIAAVKERMESIQESLPAGIVINPYLDRSKLIKNTTKTVATNLLEGALIVIFVLVVLLGNWRGGLVVASVIPLSLLFAFILMNVFNVWANLMSLGAIDFGIIVDGAVIIVETMVFAIHEKFLKKEKLDQSERDNIAYKSSSKMMNSAFFGQLIILIVFIPILALEGIEGKMFKPMALTFMFAMIGVMLLCLTYVPMLSSVFIKVKSDKLSFGDKLVLKIENFYERLLSVSLKRAKIVLITALAMFGLSVLTFSSMGGEFIPKIDEGDMAFHAILKPGTSLSETIETTTKIEGIVKEQFPEVEDIMSRTGVAEVPTDPMPMDIADIFVILKPKSEWRDGLTKADLIEEMKKAVSILPGINFEFSQPIEMRFNELITGVREDVAVKLFGEDLDVLASKAEEMGRLISQVEGVGDMKVESTQGLPQITIQYNRQKIAQHGLSIREVNRVVESAFAGGKAGVIFEGEKRFDLVVRLASESRQGIDDIKNLYVNLDNNVQIPLREIADISYVPGPMQISRDNTQRRTYVGVNVRGRDVQSVVIDIQEKLKENLTLPAGYFIEYGGAFENLQRATSRLKLVLPIALALIFILIFFALKSMKQTFMIYMAIPLAAIGGVFSLWLRDMPFSISAGVGFIVLFGVAVLNGLVLISGWNELKDEGITDLDERIHLGAKRRIRPILLTALTDVLGFLPMAISTSAGAEVQQPLATVVIGGMISATLLTLVVLPILYRWMESPSPVFPKRAVAFTAIASVLVFPFSTHAQELKPSKINSLDKAISIGLENNGYVEAQRTNIALEEQGRKQAMNLGKTQVGLQYGQYNSYEDDFIFMVDQKMEFPTVYGKQKQLANSRVKGSQYQLAMTENELRRDIRLAWYELSYLRKREDLLLFEDTLFDKLVAASQIRYETKAISLLEKVTVETQMMEVKNALYLINSDILIQEQQLRLLLNESTFLTFDTQEFSERLFLNMVDSSAIANNPKLSFAKQQVEIANAEQKVQSAKFLPDLKVGYFNQSMIGIVSPSGEITNSSDRLSGIQGGITVPLFFGSYKANVKSAKIKADIANTRAEYYETVLYGRYEQKLQEVVKYRNSLNYYKDIALDQSVLIYKNAQRSYELDAIGYVEYFQNLKQGLSLRLNYLHILNQYNQAVIQLEYILGQ
jgi:cobalt-zinc-cadmium resistance protein CzcA